MEEGIGKISRFIIFIAFELIVLSIGIMSIIPRPLYFATGIVSLIVLMAIGALLHKFIHIKNGNRLLVFLAVVCIFVKGYIGYSFRPIPVHDYYTFNRYANLLVQNRRLDNELYLALFPHVFSYSEFLSCIFKIFGNSLFVVTGVNILLSTVSVIFIYKISERINGTSMAVICSVLWILFPSQSLWNSFVLSEPLYVCLLLVFWYLCVKIQQGNVGLRNKILLALLAGTTLVVFNMMRPIGIIGLIALFIWYFMVNLSKFNLGKIMAIIVILLTFIIGSIGVTWHIRDRIGTQPGGFSWYNVAVGLNEQSQGSWNQEDWDFVLGKVNEYALTGSQKPAVETQDLERDIVSERIKNLQYPGELLINKFLKILGDDNTVLEHLQASDVEIDALAYKHLTGVVNGFYYMLVLGSMAGGILFVIKDKEGGCSFILLYSIGLTLAHLIVEVQGRYHYSILVGFVFATGYALASNPLLKEK